MVLDGCYVLRVALPVGSCPKSPYVYGSPRGGLSSLTIVNFLDECEPARRFCRGAAVLDGRRGDQGVFALQLAGGWLPVRNRRDVSLFSSAGRAPRMDPGH